MRRQTRLFFWTLTLSASFLTLWQINKIPKSTPCSFHTTNDESNHLSESDTSLLSTQKSVIKFLAQPVSNDFNFRFVLNPYNACDRSKTDLLIVVPSAPGNFERRDTIRKGKVYNYTANAGHNTRLLFFISVSHNDPKNIQERVKAESRQFGDVVQMDFQDTYKNIVLKSVSMLKWASTFCQLTKFVIRADDDVEIKIRGLVSVLEKTQVVYDNFILGIKRTNENPVRDPTSRWGKYYMPYEEYPQENYPPFLIGGLLGYPIETVQLLYQAALRVKPIWLDDVFITGLCAPKVNVPIFQDPKFSFKHNGTWAH